MDSERTPLEDFWWNIGYAAGRLAQREEDAAKVENAIATLREALRIANDNDEINIVMDLGERIGALDLMARAIREAGETITKESSPSGWEEITGLSVEERMMLDELAHGLVKPKSLKWICDMIRERQRNEN